MGVRVRNKKIDEDVFLRERENVLSLWPTGREVDLEEAIGYQKSLPDYKNFSKVVANLRREGGIVVFPRAGTPILAEEIELNQTLVEIGLPLIPVTTDSFTRLGRFDRAAQGLEESIRTGQPKLNGWPVVVHGLKNNRKMTENTPAALNLRVSNIGGAQLMAEIGFAGGITSMLLDPILTFVCYEQDKTARECFEYYQYTYRLIGYYNERGVELGIDLDGPMPFNMQFPHSVQIAGIITDALIAAEQGVKNIIPHSGMYGHMAQDIASARLVEKLTREYLDRFGFKDVLIPGLFLDPVPLFPYPHDLGMCFGFLSYSAFVGALAKAEATSLRTIDEGAGIPTKDAQVMSFQAGKWIFDVVRAQKIEFDTEQIKIEEKMLEMETRAIMDKTLELGDGDVIVGYEKGIENGLIDYPLACNRNCKGQVFSVRDLTGACRYLDFGNLPIPQEAKEFHRAKIAEREKAEGRKMDSQVAIADFFAFSKGKILSTPAFSKSLNSSASNVLRKQVAKKQITVVTGTIGQDSHVIGTKLSSRFLREQGFKTVELGGLTPPDDFIGAAKETNAAAILVSSLYGMAEIDLKGFKKKCVEAGLSDVLLYLGGYLAVGKHDWKEDEAKFKEMGFNRVYPPEVDLEIAVADLKEDLKKKGKL